MTIENFNEIPAYIEANKDSDDIKKYISGLITPDRVESFLNNDEGKKILKPKLESYFNNNLKTWQDQNLAGLVDTKVKELYPEADPKDTKIKELEDKFEKMQKDSQKKELTNKALKLAQEKKLPPELVDYFIGKDEETTKINLEALEKVFTEKVNLVAEERLKGGYKPPKNSGSNLTAEEQAKAQINKIFGIK